MAQLPALEVFDCDGDSTTLGSRWERWKRALEIYLVAANIEDATKKRATLLHSAGLALQEIYYNLPGANVEAAEGTDVYKTALDKLTEYFSPKQSFLYERHVFRPGEKFDKFLLRLREQKTKCNFGKSDDNLIDQITEKCISTELRKKILMLGDTATMEKIIIEANTLETVGKQLNEFGDKQTTPFTNRVEVQNNKDIEYQTRLKHVLEVLKDNNVLLNDKKCIFNASHIQFLGHKLSAEGIKPLDKYIEGIKLFREPRTVEEVQSFLGLATYIGKWIPNLATLTEPIRQILQQKLHKHGDISKFWSEEQQTAFNQLKCRLGDIRSLGYYDPKDKTQVMADAKPVGLGAILIQFDKNGPRTVAYGNKSLTDVEKRYCQTEKEALALVWAIEHFKMYLYGLREFELIMDHKPLEGIFGPRSKPCARIERWVLRLQGYNFKTIYRPGKSNLADPLSRSCTNSTPYPFEDEYYINQIVQYGRPIAVSLQEIINNSQNDKEIALVKDGLQHGNWDASLNNYKVFEHELWLHDNILLRGTKIVIPLPLRERILQAAREVISIMLKNRRTPFLLKNGNVYLTTMR